MRPSTPFFTRVRTRLLALLKSGVKIGSRSPQRPTTDLNHIVTHALPNIDRILGERIEVRANLERRPVVVYSDAAAIEQMLLNLALNARDAMRAGGRLTIETIRIDPHEDAMGFTPPSPGRGCLIVNNTGAGSLGLASVAFTANQFDGRLRLEIRPYGGTCISVELPLAIDTD